MHPLEKYRLEHNLTQKELAEIIQVDKGNLSKIISGKSGVSNDVAYRIKEKLGIDMAADAVLKKAVKKIFKNNKEPYVAANYISEAREPVQPYLRLEAKPLHLSSDPNDYDNDGSRFEELPDGTLRMRVPIIPHKAFAGYLRGFQDAEFYEDLNTISIDVFKKHSGTYLAFEVKGDSMTTLDPSNFKESIFDGSIVVGRELSKHQWKYKLHTHNYDAWVIVHKTEGILIKKIVNHNVEAGDITIHSLNPDKNEYPDQDLHLDDIEQIFNIVQIVNKR